ncbi:MAG: helicase [Chloroflexota bacterium]|nr:MAG: helicase [Chloroflexota bacterium]
MSPTQFLTSLRSDKHYANQIVHLEHLAPRAAKYARLEKSLHPALQGALKQSGIEKFFSHQAHAINAAREGYDVVVATSTSSGKTLCYNIPVLEAILDESQSRALYLFPTKALAQDQLRALEEITRELETGTRIVFDTYDGDTKREARTKLRRRGNIILTNPDMLSLGILPNHSMWADFIANLKYIVIDEAHVYRGVFGSQVACVLRRLRRICEYYSANPQFIFCSATIANPGEHVHRLSGRRAQVIAEDGAPRGQREFALWNPPFIDKTRTTRRSANSEAAHLFSELVREKMRNITFVRARKLAELVLLYARDNLKRTAPELVDKVKSYRAGYLADERRAIERDLFSGKLLGVTATNALELGIDVGHLDATVVVGFPGTIASLWQQVGRSGRGTRDALSILVGMDDPLNQFFMRHPEVLFAKPVEHALIYPDNPYILEKHLPCAAYELPLTNADEDLFGPGFVEAMIRLERSGTLDYRNEQWYFRGLGYPAEKVNIRSVSDQIISLVDTKHNFKTIEEIEATTAMQRCYEGAIYLHQGESYLITKLDLEAGAAYCKPVDVDFYTEVRENGETRILKALREREVGNTLAYYGDVRVTEQIVGYRRKRQFTEEVLATIDLDYPPQLFDTKAVWWDIPGKCSHDLSRAGCDFAGAMHAAEHACIGLLPLFAMCDRWDIGGLSILLHPDTGKPQIFIYDGFPGGIGITEKAFALLESLWTATLETIEQCPCEFGCPSCVQSPKCGNNNEPLDKKGAVILLRGLLGKR